MKENPDYPIYFTTYEDLHKVRVNMMYELLFIFSC